MDYLLQYTDLPAGHILLALIFALVGADGKRKYGWKSFCLGLLIGWLFLTLSSTVLSRVPYEGNHLQMHLFWSYRAGSRELILQDILNVFLLMPVGVLMPGITTSQARTGATSSPLRSGRRENVRPLDAPRPFKGDKIQEAPGFLLTIVFGFAWSLMIESLQYVTQRGLFECDDLFHNTLGVVIGVLIYQMVRQLRVDTGQPDRMKNLTKERILCL